jgi:hypothetical protein
MRVYVRKITKAKWPKPESEFDSFKQECIESLSADAVTSDLKTSSNKLSLWYVDESDIDDAILAIATSTKADRIETIDYILIPEETLALNGICEFDCEKGETAVPSLMDKHKNIINLNYKKIGVVAGIVATLTKQNPQRKRKKEIEDIIRNHKKDIEIERFSKQRMKDCVSVLLK